MREFKVLSIDAWADFIDGEGEDETICWTWNAWHSFDTYREAEHGELTNEAASAYFQALLADPSKISDYEIYDDQYNVVLIRCSDSMPILAIEYGSQVY